MRAINKVASLLNQSIDISIAYLRENAVAILALILLWRFLMRSFSDRYPNGWWSEGYSLSTSTTETATQEDRNRREEMRKVRERQQQLADERAKAAAILREEKEAKEKERKNQAALMDGYRLGDGSRPSSSSRNTTSSSSRLRTNDFNPMEPWNTGTSSYRPTRRTPPGGGS